MEMASRKNGDVVTVGESAQRVRPVAPLPAAGETAVAAIGAVVQKPAPAVARSERFAKTQALATTVAVKAVRQPDGYAAFGGTLGALVQSGQIWAAGLQDIGRQVAALTQAQLESVLKTWQALAQAKSVQEALDLETALARDAVEAAITHTGRLTGASLKLTGQALAPILARVTLAGEKLDLPV
jgi:hypothetical protein